MGQIAANACAILARSIDRGGVAVVDVQEIQARVDAILPWHYEFDLGGVRTPIYRDDFVNRHRERRRIGFDPLTQVAGGSLRGKRVLDLGSNAGYWSLAAIEAGADFVLGIDGRQMHIEQADLVFEAKGVDRSRYRFDLGNIFEYDFDQGFDVVLCLGLMYHIAKPVELFELFSRVDASLILIDTTLSLLPTSAFRVEWEKSLDDPRAAVDYEIVLIPTRQAVIDLARQFGYDAVSLALPINDATSMADYEEKSRAMFICAKGISLDGLDREKLGQLGLQVALAKKIARRTIKRGRRLVRR
jgi:2-polyprenyl-3-methyl-5-hydroxy-6-metoxy-1,4-benzoquinol methylase